MTTRGLKRAVAALALATLTTTGLALPAHAQDRNSPEGPVEAFWDHIQFGQPNAALKMYKQSCVDKVNQPKLRKASRELSEFLEDYDDTYIFTGNYKEKLSGNRAIVNYAVKIREYGVRNVPLLTFYKQEWVRINGKWLVDCDANPIYR